MNPSQRSYYRPEKYIVRDEITSAATTPVLRNLYQFRQSANATDRFGDRFW